MLISYSAVAGPVYPSSKLDNQAWRIVGGATAIKGMSRMDGKNVERTLRLAPNQLFFVNARTVVRQDGQYLTNVPKEFIARLMACKKALKRDYAVVVDRLKAKPPVKATPKASVKAPVKPTPKAPAKVDTPLYDASQYSWYKYTADTGMRIATTKAGYMMRKGTVWGVHSDSKRTKIILIVMGMQTLRVSDKAVFDKMVARSTATKAPKLKVTVVTPKGPKDPKDKQKPVTPGLPRGATDRPNVKLHVNAVTPEDLDENGDFDESRHTARITDIDEIDVDAGDDLVDFVRRGGRL